MCKGAVTTKKVEVIISTSKSDGTELGPIAIQWGSMHEDVAYEHYHSSQPLVRKSGIFISSCGFLAASPDGVVCSTTDNQLIEGVIEIKCLYSCRNRTVRDGCTQLKPFYCSLIPDGSGLVNLKRNHNYYYQVQGVMAITGAKWCDFIVWTPKECVIERIPFNPKFRESMYTNMRYTYYNYVLPELVYPCTHLELDIINYQHFHETFYPTQQTTSRSKTTTINEE